MAMIARTYERTHARGLVVVGSEEAGWVAGLALERVEVEGKRLRTLRAPGLASRSVSAAVAFLLLALALFIFLSLSPTFP